MTTKPRVLLTNPIHPALQPVLAQQCDIVLAPDTSAATLTRLVADVDALMVRAQLPPTIFDNAPKLRAVVRHGVGLDIAHYQYHKHGAYLIEHSDLPGFSRRDQQALALLVRGHRRNIPLDRLQELGPEGEPLLRLTLLLRFAILFHHIRHKSIPDVQLSAGERSLDVQFPDGWLAENPLTQADFELEAQWLERVGYRLSVR